MYHHMSGWGSAWDWPLTILTMLAFLIVVAGVVHAAVRLALHDSRKSSAEQ